MHIFLSDFESFCLVNVVIHWGGGGGGRELFFHVVFGTLTFIVNVCRERVIFPLYRCIHTAVSVHSLLFDKVYNSTHRLCICFSCWGGGGGGGGGASADLCHSIIPPNWNLENIAYTRRLNLINSENIAYIPA